MTRLSATGSRPGFLAFVCARTAPKPRLVVRPLMFDRPLFDARASSRVLTFGQEDRNDR